MYTASVQTQIVIALLKKNNIKKCIVSPGTQNIPFVRSVQVDPFFEVYSCVDERSAAYMACGLSSETGEPVVISCTEATASRNYYPGLTEAFYRKLPIIALTSSHQYRVPGSLDSQTIDRTATARDIVKESVHLPVVNNKKEFVFCNKLINKAFIALFANGGGPVHINLQNTGSRDFSIKELPSVVYCKYSNLQSDAPIINPNWNVVIFIGSHRRFSTLETDIIDSFCERNNAVVFSDNTSGYNGKFLINNSLCCFNLRQAQKKFDSLAPNLIIHIGNTSGDVATETFLETSGGKVWRISEDGIYRGLFTKTEYTFDCLEIDFFRHYSRHDEPKRNSYFNDWCEYSKTIYAKIGELPFSNAFIEQHLSQVIPTGSTIHFGILNSLRNSNFAQYNRSNNLGCNVGGFGIDGAVSTLVGASLANPQKLCFLVVGDLAFFYDMNVLGNRHLGNNVRILIVNNGMGIEFRKGDNAGVLFGDEANDFIAAAGHFVNHQTHISAARSWVEGLGFKYLSASSKEEFLSKINDFISESDEAVVFECFVDYKNDADVFSYLRDLDNDYDFVGKAKEELKKTVKKVLKR